MPIPAAFRHAPTPLWIGKCVWVRWGGQFHLGTVALFGVSRGGQERVLVQLGAVWKWFAPEEVRG